MSLASFNLVDNAWIPMEDSEGRPREVGLAELFARAKDVRRIVHPSPLVTAALYRLAFAIMHRAVRIADDEEWELAWEEMDFASAVGEYLAKHRARFDLFDEEAPFMQVLDMPEHCKATPWTKLALELPPNSSKLLFDHTVTIDPPLATPAEAARALVAAQSFAVGAGNSCMGYTFHAPLAAALVVIPEGRNLAETLLANLTPGSETNDRPTWETGALSATQVTAVGERRWRGPAERLTWPARSVFLEPEDEAGNVRWIRFATGLKPTVVEGDRDPWVSYRVTKEGKRVARKLDPNRMIWRDFHGMLAGSEDGEAEAVLVLARLALLTNSDRRPPSTWSVLVAGLVADKANVNAWRQERWMVPENVVAEQRRLHAVNWALAEAEEVGKQVSSAVWTVAFELLGGAELADRSEASILADALPTATAYWSALETRFQGLLALLGTEVDAAYAAWFRYLGEAVRTASKATHSVLGRDARALKAWAKGGQKFDRLIKRLDRKAKGFDTDRHTPEVITT